MSGKPEWSDQGPDWPNRAASRFVTAGGLRWHVQEMGSGPPLLLLHGAGAATHSWRGLTPLLAQRFHVLAPDLPGHAFTDTPDVALSLPEMARRLTALLEALSFQPALVVGHSAGAAIALRLTLDGAVRPGAIVAINGALLPFPGLIAPLFQGLAKALFANPLTAHIVALRARNAGRIARLMESTGSPLDAEGIALYAGLFQSPRHVAATLGMMANWDLTALKGEYGRVTTPLTLVVGARDAAVPPSVAAQVCASIPGAEIVTLEGVGHLAHEERPDLVAAVIEQAARARGVLPPATEEAAA